MDMRLYLVISDYELDLDTLDHRLFLAYVAKSTSDNLWPEATTLADDCPTLDTELFIVLAHANAPPIANRAEAINWA